MSIKNLHWLTVGYVSDAAYGDIKRTGGQVMQLSSEPPVTLVGIAFDSTAHPISNGVQLTQK